MAEITIDSRSIRAGGIGTYLQTLFSELSESAAIHSYAALVNCQESFAWSMFPFVMTLPVRPRVYSPTEHWLIPRAVATGSLLHVPHFNVPLFFRGPLVTTIHDLIHLQMPQLFQNPAAFWYVKWMISNAIRSARQIITGSNATKELLLREGASEHRVHVIPYKVSRRLLEAEPDHEQMTSRGLDAQSYFLYVGRFQLHKNIHGLLDGFAEFCRRNRDVRLVTVVYKVDSRFQVGELLSARGLTGRVVFLQQASFAFLKALYQGCLAVVLPSIAEGFGLPVLEAMTLGAPVIGSSIPPIVEVAQNCAVLFNPRAPRELAEAMFQLAGSSRLREDLIARGLTRSRDFIHSHVGRAHLRVYEAAF